MSGVRRVSCRSQTYPSLSPLRSRLAPVSHAPLSRITTAAGEWAPLVLVVLPNAGSAYAPGCSKKLIIMTGGTSLLGPAGRLSAL